LGTFFNDKDMKSNQKKTGKKTVIIGASPNPGRFSYKAAHMLLDYGHDVIPIGIRKGKVGGIEIADIRQYPSIEDVDTVTLYINPKNQLPWYDYILQLSPNRIIFNPGTENPELMQKARDKGIEVVQNCTLVMLQSGIF
jgi:hypothetical protein